MRERELRKVCFVFYTKRGKTFDIVLDKVMLPSVQGYDPFHPGIYYSTWGYDYNN